MADGELQTTTRRRPQNFETPRTKSTRPEPRQHEGARRRSLAASLAELFLVVAWFYLCDRWHAFPIRPRQHDLRSFGLVLSIAAVVANAYESGSGKPSTPPTPPTPPKHEMLGRHQTDEWKGVMQLWILLSHYFNCTETYKVVRLFVASFSWMTGYGNCSYYIRSNDFSVRRLVRSVARLNAFAALCCVALGNQYMLYYICPLTTLHTISVYVVMAAWPSAKSKFSHALLKVAAAAAVVAVVWEDEAVFRRVWSPLRWLLRYDGPSFRSDDPMHEWHFRSGLEKYVWLHGMLFALVRRPYERLLLSLSSSPQRGTLRTFQFVVATACLAAGAVWYRHAGHLDKYAYNRVHPYTSFVPVTIFVLLRNLDVGMWSRSFGGFYRTLGAISLELCT